jgi:dolichyl-phosphate-mannose--protein O-mannosyl transferase
MNTIPFRSTLTPLLSQNRIWLALIVPGIAMRLLWVVFNPHVLVWDEQAYHELANHLAQGSPYGPPFWPPGWPMTLAVLYSIFGVDPTYGVWLNLLIRYSAKERPGLL